MQRDQVDATPRAAATASVIELRERGFRLGQRGILASAPFRLSSINSGIQASRFRCRNPKLYPGLVDPGMIESHTMEAGYDQH